MRVCGVCAACERACFVCERVCGIYLVYMMRGALCLAALALCSFVGLLVCTMLNGTAAVPAPVAESTETAAAAATADDDIAAEPVPHALRKLSRRKRYVAFPEGSSFSVRTVHINSSQPKQLHLEYMIGFRMPQVAFCLTIGFVGNPVYTYFSWSTNWGVAYDLPNETWILGQNQAGRQPVLPRPVVVRRHRRDLYGRLEALIDK